MIILQFSEIPELCVSEMKLGGLKVSNAVTIQLCSWLSAVRTVRVHTSVIKNWLIGKQSRHNDSSVLIDILEVQISFSAIPLRSSIQHERQDE